MHTRFSSRPWGAVETDLIQKSLINSWGSFPKNMPQQAIKPPQPQQRPSRQCDDTYPSARAAVDTLYITCVPAAEAPLAGQHCVLLVAQWDPHTAAKLCANLSFTIKVQPSRQHAAASPLPLRTYNH